MKTPRKFSIPRSFPMPLWLQGAVEVLLAGIFSLALLAVVVVVGWLSLDSAGGLGAVVAATGQLWLAAHGVALHLDVPSTGSAAAVQGTAHLLPLGLTWIALLFCRRAGARLARASWEGQFWQPVLGGLVAYAVLGAVLALVTGSAVLAAHPVAAALVPLWVPLVGLMWGGHRVSGSWLRLLGVSPEELARRYGQYTRWAGAYLVTAVRAARVGTLALLGGGALLFGLAVLWNWNDMIVLNQNLHAGLFGEVVLLLLQAALLPNAILYATAWSTGAGFSLGSGTEISPAITHVSGLPSLPLLGTVSPDPGSWAYLVLVLPVLAGALAGWWFVREGEDHLDDWFALRIRVRAVSSTLSALCLAVLLGLLSGAALALLGALAGGSLGVGAWTDLGPAPGRLLLWTWATVGLGVLLGRILAPMLEGSRTPRTEGAETTEPAEDRVPAAPGRGRRRRGLRRAAAPETGTAKDAEGTRTETEKTAVSGENEETPSETETVHADEAPADSAPTETPAADSGSRTATDTGTKSGRPRPAATNETHEPTAEDRTFSETVAATTSGPTDSAGEDSGESASLSALERMRRARTGESAEAPQTGADDSTRATKATSAAEGAPETGTVDADETRGETATEESADAGQSSGNESAQAPAAPWAAATPGAHRADGTAEKNSAEAPAETTERPDESGDTATGAAAGSGSTAAQNVPSDDATVSEGQTAASTDVPRTEEAARAEESEQTGEPTPAEDEADEPVAPHAVPEHRPVIARPKRRRRS